MLKSVAGGPVPSTPSLYNATFYGFQYECITREFNIVSLLELPHNIYTSNLHLCCGHLSSILPPDIIFRRHIKHKVLNDHFIQDKHCIYLTLNARMKCFHWTARNARTRSITGRNSGIHEHDIPLHWRNKSERERNRTEGFQWYLAEIWTAAECQLIARKECYGGMPSLNCAARPRNPICDRNIATSWLVAHAHPRWGTPHPPHSRPTWHGVTENITSGRQARTPRSAHKSTYQVKAQGNATYTTLHTHTLTHTHTHPGPSPDTWTCNWRNLLKCLCDSQGRKMRPGPLQQQRALPKGFPILTAGAILIFGAPGVFKIWCYCYTLHVARLCGADRTPWCELSQAVDFIIPYFHKRMRPASYPMMNSETCDQCIWTFGNSIDLCDLAWILWLSRADAVQHAWWKRTVPIQFESYASSMCHVTETSSANDLLEFSRRM